MGRPRNGGGGREKRPERAAWRAPVSCFPWPAEAGPERFPYRFSVLSRNGRLVAVVPVTVMSPRELIV